MFLMNYLGVEPYARRLVMVPLKHLPKRPRVGQLIHSLLPL